MLTRIIAGVIGAVFIIALLLLNIMYPVILNIIVMIVSVLCVHEALATMGMVRYYRVYIPSILLALLIPAFGSGHGQIFWYLYTLIVFGVAVLFNGETPVKSVILSYGVTILIVFSLKFLIEIKDCSGNLIGCFNSLIALATAWLADTGGYFFGTCFGKHKLCKKISPKKTVEGAIGGILFCIVFLNLISFTIQKFVFKENVLINYPLITVIAAIGSVISIIGDLSFSVIKREFQVKDFGNVIPGHGGLLDRFDSVIFVVPFVYIILKFIPLTL